MVYKKNGFLLLASIILLTLITPSILADGVSNINNEDVFIIEKFDKPEKVSGPNVSVSEENTRLFDVTARLEMPAEVNTSIGTSLGESLDTTEYNYLNMWIYLPQSYPSNYFNVCVYKFDLSGYYRKRVYANWTGWRLISLETTAEEFTHTQTGDWTKVGRVGIYVGGWGIAGFPEDTYLNIDMMWFSKEKPSVFEIKGASPSSGFSLMPIVDTKATISFSSPLAEPEDDAIEVFKETEKLTEGYLLDIQGKNLNITFEEELDFNTKYTIKLNKNYYDAHGQYLKDGAEYSFTTAEKSLIVSKPIFTNSQREEIYEIPEEGLIAAEASVKNPFSSSKSAALVLAVYSSDGKMISMSVDEADIAPGEEANLLAELEGEFSGLHAKAFVCDNLTDLNLLRSDYAVLSAPVFENIYGPINITKGTILLDEPTINLNTLNISGETDIPSNAVLISLTYEDGEQILLTAIEPSSDGSFEYTYEFDGLTAKGGEYKLFATSLSMTSTKSYEIAYMSDIQKEMIVNGVNTADSISEVLKLLQENAPAIGISNVSNTELPNMANALIEQRPFSTYEEFVEIIPLTQRVFEKLNSSSWSALSGTINEYKDLIIFDNPDYAYYLGLSEKNQNTINKNIALKGYESFIEFRAAFSNAVKEYKSSLNQDGSNGRKNTSTSKGGSSYSVDSSQVVKPPATAPEPSEPITEVFSDLDLVLWAKEDILKLHELGVVSGDGNKFYPSRNITREEFVKMLIEGLKISAANDESYFLDVPSDMWYSKYISSAKAVGIIGGTGEGMFGLGENITRQDMAAIAHRAIKHLGKNLPTIATKSEFSDHSNISNYAADAVYEMQMAQIINGMGDGTFAPLENSNRAQAAKIIAGLIDAVR